MSMFILDTDILSLFQTGHGVVRANIATKTSQDMAVTIITVEEQLSGWYSFLRKTKPPDKVALGYDRMTEMIASVAKFRILSYNVPAMNRFDELIKLKLNIGRNDLRIAAIALEHDATVVTRNARDFQQVPSLTIVDWSR